MKNRKINVDRPQLSTDEIMAGKNFDVIVRNHQFMSKPFYKQGWFFGTTGLASLGLIIGGALAFQSSAEEDYLSEQVMNTEAPPNWTAFGQNLITPNTETDEIPKDIAKKTIVINLEKETPIEETFTQENLINTESDLEADVVIEPDAEPVVNEEEQQDLIPESERVEEDVISKPEKAERSAFLDMSPRISNKMGGSITRSELLDNKGITTEGDINVIHFELHLIDGLGGKVFAEQSNQLNQEMKDALENVGQGETIYFENIRGKVKNGTEVRLNPLRYVLMN